MSLFETVSGSVRRAGRMVQKKTFPLVMTTFRAWAKRTMAVPEIPQNHRVFPVTVARVETLAPHLRRIVLRADQLTEITTRYDEYFGLLIPPAGRELVLPEAKDLNVRAALMDIDEIDRPEMRFYTVRHHDRATGEVTVDIVTHGDSGPGSSFALHAQPGDVVGYRTLAVPYCPNSGPQLLIADPTALPAVRAIAEQLDGNLLAATTVVAAIGSHDCVEEGLDALAQKLARLVVLEADVDEAKDKLTCWLKDNPPTDVAFAWICAEQSVAAAARRVLVKELGVEKTKIMFSGYWKRGKARA